jgi:N-acetyl-gamma-glutamylphosphate reductase
MNRLVIVGATGMVGGYALRYALEHPDVERVMSIGRRKVSLSHPKLTEVLHPDFADCSYWRRRLRRRAQQSFVWAPIRGW